MRMEYRDRGLVVYEKERDDLLQEAVVAMARRAARDLDDVDAAGLSTLFDSWMPGAAYRAGERISGRDGILYRVAQDHTAQADWPAEETPALYTRLGVTAEEPDAIPNWMPPTGVQDAYQKGDQVRYQEKTYECTVEANVWAPGVAGWTELADV